jgi:hypothetical protein
MERAALQKLFGATSLCQADDSQVLSGVLSRAIGESVANDLHCRVR